MPSFSFVGDEPLSLSLSGPSSVTEAEKTKINTQLPKPLPLKDITNTKMGGVNLKDCPSAPDTSQNEELLRLVKRQWTTGKGNHQTPLCRKMIRSCLLNNLRPAKIAAFIVSDMIGELQNTELTRANACIKRMIYSSAAGKAPKKNSVDIEHVAPLDIPFQKGGVVYKKGDIMKKREPSASDVPNASFDVDRNAKNQGSISKDNLELSKKVGVQKEVEQPRIHPLDAAAAAAAESTDCPIDAMNTAVITPSNSMEEVDIMSVGTPLQCDVDDLNKKRKVADLQEQTSEKDAEAQRQKSRMRQTLEEESCMAKLLEMVEI